MSLTTGKRQGKMPVNTLLPYTFLCTIGPSVTAATSLFIVRTLMCRYHFRNDPNDSPPGDPICNNNDVEALTGSVMAGLATLDGLASFLSTSYVQKLSDKFGRRPLLIALPLFALVSTGSMMVAYAIHNNILAWVLLLVTGVFVSASTKSIFVPTLCVADIATDEERTRFYSRLEAVALLGPGLAYITSALVSRYSSIVLFPYFIALGAQVLASLYAFFYISETLPRPIDMAEEDEEHEEPETIMEELVAPIRPLALLVPHRDDQDGTIHWKLTLVTLSLLTTTAGTVFIATASLLYLSDKFNFNPEKNAWVLAYLTFSRFAYLTMVFPLVLRLGRRIFRWWGERSQSHDEDRSPLLRKEGSEEEANHFDVILAFTSVAFDAISLVLVSMSSTVQQVLASFGVLALGAGDNPTFKSVFVSAVPPRHASEALAALDMVLSSAKLASPPILGSLYAAFVEEGRPELLFLAAGGCCVAGCVFLTPLIFTGRR